MKPLAFKSLELSDRKMIQPLLVAYGPETSEMCFASLFLWQEHFKYKWALCDKSLLLAGEDAGGAFGLMPISGAARAACAHRLMREFGRLEWVDDRLAMELADDKSLVVTPARDAFDYLYRRDDLAALAGAKFQAKRNHIHRFLRTHNCRYGALEEAHVPACVALAEEWRRQRPRAESSLPEAELAAIREGLHNMKSLGLQGGLVWVGDKIEAFSLGSLLTADTAVIHVEKTNPKLPGLYPLINQWFIKNAWESVGFINREDDLGEPGLRKSKLSYRPLRLVKKYRVSNL